MRLRRRKPGDAILYGPQAVPVLSATITVVEITDEEVTLRVGLTGQQTRECSLREDEHIVLNVTGYRFPDA